MHYNISPETLFDVLSEDILPRKFVKDRYVPDFEGVGMIDGTFDVPHENKYSVAPNGARFTKTKRGFLPIVVERVFLQRKDAKTKEFLCDKLATKASQILAKRRNQSQ
ncbi:DNA polymerase [Vibrio phage vB_VmeM-32]|nr:DNA polymerase [Vibrio phage vB_VmeM-32]